MSKFKKMIAGGIKRAEFGFYDSEGLLCGAVTSLANGEDSGMVLWQGMKSVDASFPEWETLTQTGDDQRQGTLRFSPTDPSTLAIQMGVNDMDIEASLQGMTAYDDGQFEVLPIDAYLEELPPASLIVHSTAKKRVPGTRTEKGLEVHVFNYGEINSAGPDGLTERELRNYDYFMTLEQAFTYPWGAVISKANYGTPGATAGKFVSDYYTTLHALRGDGTALSITLDWTPIGAETLARSVQVVKTAAADGAVTVLTPTTDFTLATSGAFALTAAGQGAAGDHFVIKYKHNGVATA